VKRLGLTVCRCGHPEVEHSRQHGHCLAPRYVAQRAYLLGTRYVRCACRAFEASLSTRRERSGKVVSRETQ
jgi:hypothetical protein